MNKESGVDFGVFKDEKIQQDPSALDEELHFIGEISCSVTTAVGSTMTTEGRIKRFGARRTTVELGLKQSSLPKFQFFFYVH